jgi:hypothetical protein
MSEFPKKYFQMRIKIYMKISKEILIYNKTNKSSKNKLLYFFDFRVKNNLFNIKIFLIYFDHKFLNLLQSVLINLKPLKHSFFKI